MYSHVTNDIILVLKIGIITSFIMQLRIPRYITYMYSNEYAIKIFTYTCTCTAMNESLNVAIAGQKSWISEGFSAERQHKCGVRASSSVNGVT